MKFMLTWEVHPEKRHEVFKAFSQMSVQDDQADTGKKIKLIGRWHDVARFAGYALFEADDAKAMANWALNWNSNMDILDVVPVLDDEEAREVGRGRVS